LARRREKPIAQIARDFGIEWVSTDERKELVELRRKNPLLGMEIEILKPASAYFARENVLPK
jgi:transposase